MSPLPRKRCFIAVSVDSESRAELERIQNRLQRAQRVRGRSIPTDNLHLTLAFLGALKGDQRERVSALLAEAAEGGRLTEQPLDRVGAFPGPASRLIALEGEPDPVLFELRRRLLVALAAAELPAAGKDRPFRPHVSLIRLRRPVDTLPFTTLELTLPVRELVLYESVAGEEGVSYYRLAAFDLPR